LLYLHRFDPHTPIEKTLAWFAEQKDEGRIRHIGLSNFAAWQIAKAHFIGQTLGAKISAVQPMYSLIKRQAEVEILPACTDLGIQCFSYSPLGAGLLTGKYVDQKGEGRLTTNARYAKRYGIEEMHKCAAALAKIAKEKSVHPATLAVSWILASAFAPSPIVSARSLGQLSPVLAAIDFKMDEATLGMINAVSPMPAPATDRLEEQS
jgi:aryl-alcohol dehydrogenase-like predicted oxidoreductase